MEKFNQNAYHLYDHATFDQLEKLANFTASAGISDVITGQTTRYALAKSDLENMASNGSASILELPIEAALSLNYSEKYRPSLLLILPNQEDFNQILNKYLDNYTNLHLAHETDELLIARFQDDLKTIRQHVLEEYKKLQHLAIDDSALFSMILEPADLDTLVEFLSSNLQLEYDQELGGKNSKSYVSVSRSGRPKTASSMSSSSWGDVKSERGHTADNRNLTSAGVSNILPKDQTARRQSLAQQARRKTLLFENAAVNKEVVSRQKPSSTSSLKRRHTIGSNVIFDLNANSIARRTEKALAAISITDVNSSFQKGSHGFEKSSRGGDGTQNNFNDFQEKINSEDEDFTHTMQVLKNLNELSETENNSPRTERTYKSKSNLSGRGTRTSSRTPDWEAEGIIVLPDDAVTLSNTHSARSGLSLRRSSCMSNISKKSVLPPIE